MTGLSGVAERLGSREVEIGQERELRPQVCEEVEGGQQQDRVDSSADRGQFHIIKSALKMVDKVPGISWDVINIVGWVGPFICKSFCGTVNKFPHSCES